MSLANAAKATGQHYPDGKDEECPIRTGGHKSYLLQQLFVVLSSLACVEFTPACAFFVLYGDERVSPALVTAASLDGVRNYCVICGTRTACFE